MSGMLSCELKRFGLVYCFIRVIDSLLTGGVGKSLSLPLGQLKMFNFLTQGMKMSAREGRISRESVMMD